MDATILIPTFRHPAYLPFAVRSALGQEHESCEVVVVGDGVEDDTREVIATFGSEIKFYDLPKGERHGEANRHQVLQETRGRIVCYLGDNDLLLPNHVSEMLRILRKADFTHSVPMFLRPSGEFEAGWFDISRKLWRKHLLKGDWNGISLTGAAHTMDAYRKLPFGWRPAPADVWTDMYMWQQFLSVPGLKLVGGRLCTHIKFTEEWRTEMVLEDRVAELDYWLGAMHTEEAQEAISRCAETSRKQSQDYREQS